MGAKVDILTFEGGLISELTEPRWTISNWGKGCRRSENMIPLPQGPTLSRPSSRMMGLARTTLGGNPGAKLCRTVYDESHSYLLEFRHLEVTFYTNAGQIVYPEGEHEGEVYTLVSPYELEDLSGLKVCSDAGTLYITHPDFAPYRLVYASDASWTLVLR
jgi:hypothetical protein